MKTLVFGILIVSLFVESCNSPDQGQNRLPTFDMKNFPEISEIKLSDLGFVDIKYILLESKDESFICNLNDFFNYGLYAKLRVVNDFFLVTCGNKILKFRNDGSFETIIGEKGRGPDEFTNASDITIDPKTNNIYLLDRVRKKIFTYNQHGKHIRTIPISISPSELVLCENGIICYSENHMGNIINSFDVIDTTGISLKSFPNRYPFINHDAYMTSGENLFYYSRGQIYSKQVYSDTIYQYKDNDFIPYLVIEAGDKLLTPEARSKFDNFYLSEHYIRPRNLFEFGNYLYYDFCYGIKTQNNRIMDVSKYRFIGSKKDNTYSLVNFEGGIINDLDGGPNIQPITSLDENTIVSVVDALEFKNYIDSKSFKTTNPTYPEKKKLELIAENIKDTDNSIIILVSLRPF